MSRTLCSQGQWAPDHLYQPPLVWESFYKILEPKSVCEVKHWCWTRRPGLPKVFSGVEVRAVCRAMKFLHDTLLTMSLWSSKGLFSKVVYPVSLRRPLELGLSTYILNLKYESIHWQTALDHYSSSTKLYSRCHVFLQVLCIPAGSVFMASIKPRRPDAEALFITPLVMWGLLAAARPRKPISRSSRHVSRGRLELCSEWCNSWSALHPSALGPAPGVWVVYHIVAKVLLPLGASTNNNNNKLTRADLVEQNSLELTCGNGGILWQCHV